jgi:hypothetical protein
LARVRISENCFPISVNKQPAKNGSGLAIELTAEMLISGIKALVRDVTKLSTELRHLTGLVRYVRLFFVVSACDGVVTGIQIKARKGDIAAYGIIKKPLKTAVAATYLVNRVKNLRVRIMNPESDAAAKAFQGINHQFRGKAVV